MACVGADARRGQEVRSLKVLDGLLKRLVRKPADGSQQREWPLSADDRRHPKQLSRPGAETPDAHGEYLFDGCRHNRHRFAIAFSCGEAELFEEERIALSPSHDAIHDV